jgi:hypothetical protein
VRAAVGGIALAFAALGMALAVVESTLRWLPMLLPGQVRAVNNRMETAIEWDESVSGDPYLGFKPKPEVARTVKLDGVTAELRTVRLLDPDVGFRQMGAPFTGPPADIAIGDSFTVCYGVPAADCWVERLATQAGRPIVNLGVSGYSAVAAARLLERYGKSFRPRVVLHGLFLNDFEENLDFVSWEQSGRDNLRAWYHEQNLGRVGYQLYKRSRTYRLVRAFLRAGKSQTYHLQENGLNLYLSPTGWWVRATAHAVEPKYLEFMQRILLQEQESARAMGARLVVLLFPFKEQVYWDRMVQKTPTLAPLEIDRPFRLLTEFCRAQGIQTVNLTEALRDPARRGEQLYYSVDAHWNPRGNAVVADAVYATLHEHGVM